MTDPVELIKSDYSHFIIIGCAIGGLVWGGINAMFVSTIELSQHCLKTVRLYRWSPWT